jgi:hypothetical protein
VQVGVNVCIVGGRRPARCPNQGTSLEALATWGDLPQPGLLPHPARFSNSKISILPKRSRHSGEPRTLT